MRRQLPGQARRRLGGLLLAGSLVGASALGPLTPALAQQEQQSLETEKLALFASPPSDVIPDSLTSDVPPNVLCLVRSDFCPEETDELRGDLADNLGQVDDQAPSEPVQPVPPDSLAMAFEGGSYRYQSAIKLTLPEIPDDANFESFVVTFKHNAGQSYSYDSPAFRQAVQAAVIAAGTQDEKRFQEEFQKALAEDPENQPFIGVEACPFTIAFPESPPPQALPDSEIPTDDSGAPAIDCLYGTNGSYDELTETWAFDLTFAARAWVDGTLEDFGLLLRPIGAPNLAFGDADTSTNAQVIFDVSVAPRADWEVASAGTPPPPPPPPPPVVGQQQQQSPPSANSAPPASSTLFPPAQAAPPSAEVPEVAPAPRAPAAPAPVAPMVPASEPGTFWAVWLLAPIFAAGMFMLTQTLVAEPAVVTARSGAMTRLIERQHLGLQPPPVQV